jgi:UDPglucose 6-dehydrogenase
MQICVMGTGYVGLVVGTCLADTGQFVTCVDVDAEKVRKLNSGEPTIYEPGLKEVLAENIEAGRLTFTTDQASAVANSTLIFIAVGTPPLPDGSVDMSQIDSVVDVIAATAQDHKIVVMKSTVPVGTYRLVSDRLSEKASVGMDYVSNPEFLKEGNALADFTKPDRVIIGAENPQAAKTVAHLYSPFMRQSNRVIQTDPASAELTKYAANTMLAMRISFMNEMARLCDTFGGNVDDVRRGVGTDSRIGSAFLFPGLGYGGFCFPKDVQALAAIGRNKDCPMHLAEATHDSNAKQVEYFLELIDRHFRGQYEGRKIAVWGLSYKAKTDDVRMSPAVAVAGRLAEKGAAVVAHDPKAMESAAGKLPDSVEYSPDMYRAIQGADALVVMTDWQEFRNPDLGRLREGLNEAVIIDGRNLYNIDEMRENEFKYLSVGRPRT